MEFRVSNLFIIDRKVVFNIIHSKLEWIFVILTRMTHIKKNYLFVALLSASFLVLGGVHISHAVDCASSGDPWSCYEPAPPKPTPTPVPKPIPTPTPTPKPKPTPAPMPTTSGDSSNIQTNTNVDFFSNTEDTNIPPTSTVASKITSIENTVSQSVVGVGDNCRAGTRIPDWYSIPEGQKFNTNADLESVFSAMAERDLRLRRVMWKGSEVTFMYLQPAYRFGFIPMNYYLTVTASADTMRINYTVPGWVSGADTQQEYIEKAFRENTPKYLSNEYIATFATANVLTRQAALAQAVAQIMYTAPVMPISNNFFVCSILPILAYVIIVAVFVLAILFFIIRKLAIKKRTHSFIQHLHIPDQGILGGEVRSPSSVATPKPFTGTPSIEQTAMNRAQVTQAHSIEKSNSSIASVSDPSERQKLDDLYQKRIAELKARQSGRPGIQATDNHGNE